MACLSSRGFFAAIYAAFLIVTVLAPKKGASPEIIYDRQMDIQIVDIVPPSHIQSAGDHFAADLKTISPCRVEADTDGDGTYTGLEDYDSGVILWTEL